MPCASLVLNWAKLLLGSLLGWEVSIAGNPSESSFEDSPRAIQKPGFRDKDVGLWTAV